MNIGIDLTVGIDSALAKNVHLVVRNMSAFGKTIHSELGKTSVLEKKICSILTPGIVSSLEEKRSFSFWCWKLIIHVIRFIFQLNVFYLEYRFVRTGK